MDSDKQPCSLITNTYVQKFHQSQFHPHIQDQVIPIHPKRRNAVADEIRTNFKSLPGQSYFDKLTDRLAQPYLNSRLDKSLIGHGRSHRRVRIRCKWSELVASPVGQINSDKIISQLMRRRLSKVLEEETEFSTDDEEISTNRSNKLPADLNFRESLDSQMPKLAACDNFQLILQELKINKEYPHDKSSGFRLFRQDAAKGRQAVDFADNNVHGKSTMSSSARTKPKCFELFSIHKTSQLVHRNQPLIEAERLAKRLIDLTSHK